MPGSLSAGIPALKPSFLSTVLKATKTFLLFLSGPVSNNETAMTEICEYAINSGLSLIVFFGDLDSLVLAFKNLEWRLSWIKMAKQKWGDKFRSILYYYDEPGGIFIDYKWNESILFGMNLYSSIGT